jgi:hypothetical protein
MKREEFRNSEAARIAGIYVYGLLAHGTTLIVSILTFNDRMTGE